MVSQPVSVILEKDQTEDIVLEIASKISDTSQIDSDEISKSFHMLEDMQNKIYLDPLTEAYNRRFLDELMFLHHGQNKVTEKIAVIMLDLSNFKQINDLFGHQTGDRVLKEVVNALKEQIRQEDSVIRYGGDEFVIVLPDMEEKQIIHAVKRFKSAINSVKYGSNGRIMVEADFGYACTDHLIQDKVMLTELIKVADDRMYEQKRLRKHNRT